jgi:hypothetical protein
MLNYRARKIAREIVERFSNIVAEHRRDVSNDEAAAIVGEVMMKHKLTLAQASKYVMPKVMPEFEKFRRRTFLAAADEPLNV